jgi:dihydroneopterin aldolase
VKNTQAAFSFYRSVVGYSQISYMIERQPYLKIHMRGITTERDIGMHAWEKYPQRPNRLIIDIELYCAVETALNPTKETIVNYEHIREFIKTWPTLPHTDFLETAAEELLVECFKDKRVQTVMVSIRKPDVYTEIEGVGVEILRHRS